MLKSIHSAKMGTLVYEKISEGYTLREGAVHWILDASDNKVNMQEMIHRAEKLYEGFSEFDQQAKARIAGELVTFKNDFWPEYDEDDPDLDWDRVDAGEYNVSEERFAACIRLLDIVIKHTHIYCEYDDGELFGGHRIHAYFDNDYNLIRADI